MSDLPAYLSVGEFAKQLSVDKMVIYRLRDEGKIDAINVGTAKRPKLRIASSYLEQLRTTLAVAR